MTQAKKCFSMKLPKSTRIGWRDRKVSGHFEYSSGPAACASSIPRFLKVDELQIYCAARNAQFMTWWSRAEFLWIRCVYDRGVDGSQQCSNDPTIRSRYGTQQARGCSGSDAIAKRTQFGHKGQCEPTEPSRCLTGF